MKGSETVAAMVNPQFVTHNEVSLCLLKELGQILPNNHVIAVQVSHVEGRVRLGNSELAWKQLLQRRGVMHYPHPCKGWNVQSRCHPLQIACHA